jgi:antitoxin CptB
MRELDVLLEGYLEHTYPGASNDEQQAFQRLLELQDPQVLAYLLGQETPTDAELVNVIHKLASPRGAISAP